MAAIHAQFPESGIIRRMQVVHHLEAQQFFSQWPDVVRTADDICDADVQLSMTFHEAETRNAFLALSARIKNMEAATSANQEHLSAISQRTEQFSPSKRQTKGQHLQATASTPHPSTCFIPHGSFPILTPPANPVQFPLPPNYLIPAASSASTSQVPIPGGCVATLTPLHPSVSTVPSALPPAQASPPCVPTSVCSPQLMHSQVPNL
jgi:hypothetical protein